MDKRNWFTRRNKENTTPIFHKENGIYKFLDKEGFYIVLFLCICIVAATAVWVTKTHIDRFAAEDIKNLPMVEEEDFEDPEMGDDEWSEGEIGEQQQVSEQSTITVEEIGENDDSILTVAPEKSRKEPPQAKGAPKVEGVASTNAEEQPQQEKEGTEEVHAAKKIMQMPLSGKIGMNYAVDSLIYSKTLDQFTTHEGIDILAPENTPVVAALDGVVIEVVTDSRLGVTIALSHEGDMITKYANLSTDSMVQVGDHVKKGQVISRVGKTALFEIEEEPHLHFEVLIDGKNVDPNLYLPSSE